MNLPRILVLGAIACVTIAVGVTLMGKGTGDWAVLKAIWFRRISGKTHSERLESFYAPQAASYDTFRDRFLWARAPLLQQLGKEMGDKRGLVWVDLGGGTASNVEMMNAILSLDRFEAIYVVDLCHSLCEEAKKRVLSKGWKNVYIIEHDACTFVLPESSPPAHLVTFSYALSMIPNFIQAVDQAQRMMDADGWLGVCDFYVSAKYDVPTRQMSWFRRFFWQMIFDLDGIFLGHERRLYLESRFVTKWEENGQGSIPYVPLLRAPWYAWIGKKALDREEGLQSGDRVLLLK